MTWKEPRYLKLCNRDGTTRDFFQLHKGVVEMQPGEVFNTTNVGSGLYFVRPEDVVYWSDQLGYDYICKVNVVENSPVVDCGNKLKTTKLEVVSDPIELLLFLIVEYGNDAVKLNGHAIKYLKKPSEQVQLDAVQQNPFVLDHINKPSEKVLKFLNMEFENFEKV